MSQLIFQLVQRLLRLLLTRHAQHIKAGLQGIKAAQQRLNGFSGGALLVNAFNGRLQTVSHLAHAHGTGQTGTALDGVQSTQDLVARLILRGAAMPAAQRSAQLGQQVDGFFFKDGEQIGVNLIQHINVVFIVARMHSQCNGFINAALQLSFMLHAARSGDHGIRGLSCGIWHCIQQRVRGWGIDSRTVNCLFSDQCIHQRVAGEQCLRLCIRHLLGSKVQRQILGVCGWLQHFSNGPLDIIQIGQLIVCSSRRSIGINGRAENFTQPIFNPRHSLFEEPCGELMQQTAHFIRSSHTLLNLQLAGKALRLQMQQRMLKQARQF